MEDLLKRYKLIDSQTLEVKIEKSEFVKRFKSIVEKAEIYDYPSLSGLFSSWKKEYKGEVNSENFRIKNKKISFDRSSISSLITGTFRQKEELLTVSYKVNGFPKTIYFFYSLFILFYAVIIYSFFHLPLNNPSTLIVIPAILVHAAFVTGLTIYRIKKNVSRVKDQLEKDLIYLTSENFNSKRIR